MPPLADLAPLLDVGLGGLVAAGLILVFTGRLLPSGVVDKMLAGRDERIAELRELIAQEQERNCKLAEQNDLLVEANGTAARALEGIRRVAEQGPEEGE